jgi:hypothetical protein
MSFCNTSLYFTSFPKWSKSFDKFPILLSNPSSVRGSWGVHGENGGQETGDLGPICSFTPSCSPTSQRADMKGRALEHENTRVAETTNVSLILVEVKHLSPWRIFRWGIGAGDFKY